MADVNIQQVPQPVQPIQTIDTGGNSGVVWGLLVLVLLGVIAWFVFAGPVHRTTVNVNTPAAPAATSPSPPASSTPAPSSSAPTPPANSGGRGQ